MKLRATMQTGCLCPRSPIPPAGTSKYPELGLAIVASPYDWLFAKGTIASCRYFMPNHELTVLIDGTIDTTIAQMRYGIRVLDRNSVSDSQLRRLGFGWGITKMLFFWCMETEAFLYLDSDAVLWGDVSGKLDFTSADFIASIVMNAPISESSVTKWYFEIPFVEKYFPAFNWRKATAHFFCTGVFAARRGSFDLNEYKEILALNDAHPGQFKFGEMGILNLMAFQAGQKGRLRLGARNFQVIFPDQPQSDLRERFSFDEQERPIVKPGDEQVLHMPDKKPLVDNPECYSDPMTFFRLKYLEHTEAVIGAEALQRLRVEDQQYALLRVQFYRRRKRKAIIALLQGHPGTWRKLLRRLRTTSFDCRTPRNYSGNNNVSV